MGVKIDTQHALRIEFERRYTEEMLEDLVKRTKALARRYQRYVVQKSTDTAEDRIHAAVVKLFDGSRTWDPARVDLGRFLLGVIASDLTTELRRSALVPHVSLEARTCTREDDYTGQSITTTVDARSAVEDGWPVPTATEPPDATWVFAITHLRAFAAKAKDAKVLALLTAYEEGVFQKRDVLARLGWSSRTYNCTYQRLIHLADAADPDVRASIAYALAN